MEKRIGFIDVLRGIAIILIVYGHTVKGTSIFIQFCYCFTVPLFFILSGIIFKPCEDIKSAYIKKIKRIIVPYFVFALISVVIFQFLGKFSASSLGTDAETGIKENILNVFYANSRNDGMKWNTPLWFLPCYFSVFMITDSFERIIKPLTRKSIARVFFIFISVLISFIWKTFLIDIRLPFQFESAFLMSSYFEIGILLKAVVFENKITLKKVYSLLLSAFLIICGCLISIYNGYADIRGFLVGKSFALYIICSLLFSAALILISVEISKVKNPTRFFSFFGNKTLSVLVMHKFPILFFQVIFPLTKEILFLPEDSFFKFAVGMVVTFVSILLCVVADFILNKLCPFVIGR